MAGVVPGKAPQDGLGVCGAQPQGGGEFHHFVILVRDEFPVNRPRENRVQVGIGLSLARVGPVELLVFEVLEAR